ncbi:MAG: 8-oxo-dGTP diphosphatase [Chloroflexota bacterium]
MGAAEQGADQTSGRWLTVPRTLCFITHGNDLLLMKRGEQRRVFPGRYNGVGGHLERDEDPLTGALREIQEETGLSVTELSLRGISNIDAGHESGILLFVFTATAHSREVTKCDEGSLHWIAMNEVYNLPLVEDLALLLPRLFGKEKSDALFFAHVYYDEHDQLVMTFA